MALESWYYAAGIGSFFVALGALIGLAFYAADTRKMRLTSQEQSAAAREQASATQGQIEALILPCVLLLEHQSSDAVDAPLQFKNCGPGVALNIRWRHSGRTPHAWIEFPALGPGEIRRAPFLTRDVINRGPIECEFESVGGSRYSTLSGFSESTNLDYRHQFRKL